MGKAGFASTTKRASDPLTGLANRTQLGQQIAVALASAGENAVGLLFCDIDK